MTRDVIHCGNCQFNVNCTKLTRLDILYCKDLIRSSYNPTLHIKNIIGFSTNFPQTIRTSKTHLYNHCSFISLKIRVFFPPVCKTLDRIPPIVNSDYLSIFGFFEGNRRYVTSPHIDWGIHRKSVIRQKHLLLFQHTTRSEKSHSNAFYLRTVRSKPVMYYNESSCRYINLQNI